MRLGSIRAESDHAASMKSIVRLMSVGRSTKIEGSSVRLIAGRNVDTLKSGAMGERGHETKEGSEGKADHLKDACGQRDRDEADQPCRRGLDEVVGTLKAEADLCAWGS
jgi:hypothetical protein